MYIDIMKKIMNIEENKDKHKLMNYGCDKYFILKIGYFIYLAPLKLRLNVGST